MDVNVRAGVEFLRTLGVEGVKAEKDNIFDEKLDAWEELEKDTSEARDRKLTPGQPRI
jgi:hypothetical protein